jgi:zeaxanthin epoxidase
MDLCRPDLQRITLKSLDPAKVLVDSEVVSYDETGDGVTVHLANGKTATGDVLVGADGIWSAVRAQMFVEPRFKEGADYSGYTCFTGTCLHRY